MPLQQSQPNAIRSSMGTGSQTHTGTQNRRGRGWGQKRGRAEQREGRGGEHKTTGVNGQLGAPSLLWGASAPEHMALRSLTLGFLPRACMILGLMGGLREANREVPASIRQRQISGGNDGRAWSGSWGSKGMVPPDGAVGLQGPHRQLRMARPRTL